jgi:hypothetical protein
MNFETWIKKKSNKQLIFFLLGVVCLYFYTRQKAKAEEKAAGYSSLREAYVGGGLIPVKPEPGPGSIDPDAPVTGAVTPKYYGQGWEPHCQIVVSGSSGNWLLNDVGTEGLPAGHIWQYQVNGHVFRQAGRLANYSYQTNQPVSILLTPVKIGAPSLHYWGGETNWQDPNLSAGFSLNNSMGSTYIMFNKY